LVFEKPEHRAELIAKVDQALEVLRSDRVPSYDRMVK
jgi:hypothetical protein